MADHDHIRTLSIASSEPAASIAIGASIACAGICLTVTTVTPTPEGSIFTVDLSPETLSRTTAINWKPGTRINLERALKIGDELGGHWVTGHVDGLAHLITYEPMGNSHRLTFTTPANLARYIAAKGSVTLDGTSLTVNQVNGAQFTVQLIPHSWQATTLSLLTPGDAVNLEIDLMARYIERLQTSAT